MKRANANKTKQARHDSKVCAPLLDNFVIRPRDLYYRVRSCLSRKDGKKKFKIWSISLPLLLLYPSQKPNVRSRKCRSRVEAADKSRIQSFEFIRSIIFCRKLFLKRESYFSSAAYDLLSVFLGYYSVFSTNGFIRRHGPRKTLFTVFVTRFILEIFPLRWKDFIDFSMRGGREK